MREGLLVLEDGTTHHGQAIGRPGTSFGEIVFNTAMSGYQEVLTDPSYAGQIVVMTAAHIGNYGVRRDEAESDRVHVAGFVARDFPERWSGTGGEESLASYLEEAGVTGLHGLDTRALVRHIRTQGAMRAGISTEIADPQDLLRLVFGSPPMIGRDDPGGRSRRDLSFQRARRSGRAGSTDPHDRNPYREETDLRDLPGPPAPRTRVRGQDLQAEVRTSRGEPSRGGFADDGGRDHVAEPRFRRGRLHAPGRGRAHASEPERRHARRLPPPEAPDPGCPVPSGGLARSPRRQRAVRHFHRSDAAGG